eukprot:gnl/TRDRNA2_/TRDRNA2_174504_c2_seq6.p1 gnl/TRDRNA2_/TRDRNA2_174504_c2~~gnl/TRDRNA2_/TRDRNA2_174504_c2_seq6.p1  ORF type:complete len:152 (-),score=11.86 gnl/TRDRNA2_/TRDRNA2_174504_c2_seq6:70-525(-)
MNSIAAAALPKIPQFEATQNLSNTAWAFAQLSLMHGPLLDAISASAIHRIDEFVSQQLANTAWAFACLGKLDAPLSAAIAAAALRIIDSFHPSGTAQDILFGVDLRGLGWAYSFAAALDAPFQDALYAAHLRPMMLSVNLHVKSTSDMSTY